MTSHIYTPKWKKSKTNIDISCEDSKGYIVEIIQSISGSTADTSGLEPLSDSDEESRFPEFFRPPYPNQKDKENVFCEYKSFERLHVGLRPTDSTIDFVVLPKFAFMSARPEIIGVCSGMAIALIGLLYSFSLGIMSGLLLFIGPILAGLLGLGFIYVRERRVGKSRSAVYKIS